MPATTSTWAQLTVCAVLASIILPQALDLKMPSAVKPLADFFNRVLGRPTTVARFIDRLIDDDDYRNYILPALSDFSVYRLKDKPGKKYAQLSYGVKEYQAHWSWFVLNNVCHAMAHGHAHVIDPVVRPIPTGLVVHYQKVLAIRKHLPLFDGLFWLDMDTVLVRDDFDPFRDLLERMPERNLILMDHSNNINNGVVMFRNNTWTNDFVADWWRLVELYGDFVYPDQGAMYCAMFQYFRTDLFANHTECEPRDCASNRTRWWADQEFNEYLDCVDKSYRHREELGKLTLISPRTKDFRKRFNQWWFNDMYVYGFFGGSGAGWQLDDYYLDGDAVAQTKDLHFLSTMDLIDRCIGVGEDTWIEFLRFIGEY